MKDLAIAVVVAVSGILLMTITGGHGLCVGSEIPEMGDSKACNTNRTDDVATLLCRVRCIVCHLGKTETPHGCLKTEGKGDEAICHCIGGNSTVPGTKPTGLAPPDPAAGGGGAPPLPTDLPGLPGDGIPPLRR